MSETENSKIEEILVRIEAIESRNKKVAAEKAWETSLCRKLSILVLTYVVMCLVFRSLGDNPFWLNAIVPTLGFFLSSLSLPVIKAWWQSQKEQ